MRNIELLMAKFYVVDGISYPAAETACGIFNNNGYVSMKACRNLGFKDVSAKGSMGLNDFIKYIGSKVHFNQERLYCEFNVLPGEHYIQNNGYGVIFTQEEIELSRLYLVDGVTYTNAEKLLDIHDRKGFATMYAVCKAGAFSGKMERKSMTQDEFRTRLMKLGVHYS